MAQAVAAGPKHFDRNALFAPAFVAAAHNTSVARGFWRELFTVNLQIEALPDGLKRWVLARVLSYERIEGEEILTIAYADGQQDKMLLSADWSRVRVATPSSVKQFPVGMRIAYYEDLNAQPAFPQIGTVSGNIENGAILQLLLDEGGDELMIPREMFKKIKALTGMMLLRKPGLPAALQPVQSEATAANAAVDAKGETISPLLLHSPAKPRQDRDNDTPDMGATIKLTEIRRAYETYTIDSDIEVYWVDQREWRPAKVLLRWDNHEKGQLCLQVHFVGYSHGLDEELNLMDKTVYHRVRLRQLGITPEADRTTIAALWRQPQLGEEWNLINRAWWLKWLAYSGFNPENPSIPVQVAEKAGKAAHEKPGQVPLTGIGKCKALGEIDNTHLIVQGTTELRTGLNRDYNYEEIPNAVWQQLLDWYGGGPTVQRTIVKLATGALGIQLYAGSLTTWVCDAVTGLPLPIVSELSYSSGASLLTIFKGYQTIRTAVQNLPQDKSRRVWLYFANSKNSSTDAEKANETLDDSKGLNNARVSLEIRDSPAFVAKGSKDESSFTKPTSAGSAALPDVAAAATATAAARTSAPPTVDLNTTIVVVAAPKIETTAATAPQPAAVPKQSDAKDTKSAPLPAPPLPMKNVATSANPPIFPVGEQVEWRFVPCSEFFSPLLSFSPGCLPSHVLFE